MPIIYKIVNIVNNKIYIGKSKYNLVDYYGSGLQIVAAIKKYGKENFEKHILEECCEEIVNEREIYWIDILNSTNSNIGYNISKGGDGGDHYWAVASEDDRKKLAKKIGDSQRGKPRPPVNKESCIKRSITFKRLIENDPTFIIRRAALKRKMYTCVNHKNLTVHFTQNLKEFCVSNNLNFGSMQHNARTKKRLCNNDWSCRFGELSGTPDTIINQLNLEIIESQLKFKRSIQQVIKIGSMNPNAKKIAFIHENGTIAAFNGNLIKDCKKLTGCSYDKIRKLLKHQRTNIDGWKICE